MRRAAELLIPFTALLALAAILTVVRPTSAASYGSSTVHRKSDIVQFSHDLVVDHPVDASVVVLNGSATIDQPVTGDVVVLGGDVMFRNQGRVLGDVACLGGRVRGLEGGRVRGDVFAPASLDAVFLSMNPSASHQRVLALVMAALKLTILLIWLIATIIICLAAPRALRQSSIEMRGSPLHTFAIGLAAYASFILTAIIFSSLISLFVGVPLLVLLALFAIAAKVFGTISVFHAAGTLLFGARTREELTSRRFLRGDLALTIAGLLILGAIRMIPFFGAIVWGVASLFGIGGALSTAFGRREPAFLSLRTAES